jgi:hypothetical protein
MSRETPTQKTADFITPDRRTEISRLARRKQLALILWLGGTWLVFMYVYVMVYPVATLQDALMASIFPAILGAFYYFNERRTVDPKIKRLMKYELLFEEFFEAMIRDMDRNDDEKGDSWLTLDVAELEAMSDRKYADEETPERYVKLSNYQAMLYLRSKLG